MNRLVGKPLNFYHFPREILPQLKAKLTAAKGLPRLPAGKAGEPRQRREAGPLGLPHSGELDAKLIAIVIKYGPIKKGWCSRTLVNFIKRYHPARVIVVTRDYVDRVKHGETSFMYLPAWWLLVLDEILEMP